MKRKFFGRIVGCLLVVAAVSSCSNENTGFKHIAPPTVSVVEVSNIYLEGNTGTRFLAVPVILSHSTSVDVEISYVVESDPNGDAVFPATPTRTLNDPSVPNADYVFDDSLEHHVTMHHGESYAIINVEIIGDYILEANETFEVKLTGYIIDGVSYPIDTIVGTKSAVATITNDDQFLLNDTGITTCSTDAATSLLCNSADNKDILAPYPGQDANVGLDAPNSEGNLPDNGNGQAGFNFTRLDEMGAATANKDNAVCILDNNSKFVWELKTPENSGSLQDATQTFAWYNSDGLNNGGNAGTENNGVCIDSLNCDTEKYIAYINTLNTTGLCGFSDWRLPTVSELHTIISHYIPEPTVPPTPPGLNIDTEFFPYTQAGSYWTSDTVANTTANAWVFDFTTDLINNNPKTTANFIRLVRGAITTIAADTTQVGCNTMMFRTTATDLALQVNMDSTVTDRRTNLMWKQCAEGFSGSDCGTDSSTPVTWSTALTDIATLNSDSNAGFAGYKDWRLPNKKELESLVERSCSSPAINASAFPNDIANMNLFWTSSPNDANSVWVIDFTTGDMTTGDMTTPKFVRLVRDL